MSLPTARSTVLAWFSQPMRSNSLWNGDAHLTPRSSPHTSAKRDIGSPVRLTTGSLALRRKKLRLVRPTDRWPGDRRGGSQAGAAGVHPDLGRAAHAREGADPEPPARARGLRRRDGADVAGVPAAGDGEVRRRGRGWESDVSRRPRKKRTPAARPPATMSDSRGRRRPRSPPHADLPGASIPPRTPARDGLQDRRNDPPGRDPEPCGGGQAGGSNKGEDDANLQPLSPSHLPFKLGSFSNRCRLEMWVLASAFFGLSSLRLKVAARTVTLQSEVNRLCSLDRPERCLALRARPYEWPACSGPSNP